MSVQRYCVVSNSTNLVVNVILAQNPPGFTVTGMTLIQNDLAQVNDVWTGSTFTAGIPPVAPIISPYILPVSLGGTNATDAATARTNLGVTNPTIGTIASQNYNAVDVTGGSIDGTSVGATTQSTIKGTTIAATTSVTTPALAAASGPVAINSVCKFSTAPFAANGASLISLGLFGPSGASSTPKKWLTIQDSTGATLYLPCY